MIWTERTLCSTHAVQLRGAKPHGLECGRERGYLWVCSETARGYLQRLRRDAAGSEALELRTALDAVTCAADEEAEAAARGVARGIDVAGRATCSSTRMRGGGSRLLRWSLLLRSRRQDGGRGGQVAAVRCCMGALGKKAGLARAMDGAGHSLRHSCREGGSSKPTWEAPASAQSDSTAGRMAAPAASTPAVGMPACVLAAISVESRELSLRLRTWSAACRDNTPHRLCTLTCA